MRGVNIIRSENESDPKATTPEWLLQQAEELFWQGKIPQAQEHLDRLAAQEQVPDIARLQGQLLQCRILALQDPKKAQDLATQVIQASQDLNQPLIQVDTHILMAEIWSWLGKLETCFYFVDQGKNLLITIPPDMTSERTEREALLLAMEGNNYVYKGDLDQAMECLQHSLALFEQLPYSQWRTWPLYALGFAYNQQGDYERALKAYQDGLALSNQLERPLWQDVGLANLGFLNHNKGENARALECLQKSQTISEQLGYPYAIAYNLFLFGVVYAHQGEFERAFEVLQDSLTTCEQLGIPGTLAESIVYQQMGLINLQKGELEFALEYLEKSLALEETRGYKAEVAWNLIYISRVYRLQGQIKKAFESALKSLKINEETNNYLYTAYSLEALISISIELDQLESAQRYLKRLEGIKEKIASKQIDQRTKYTQALILKASPRPRDKIKAQELFQQITEEEIQLLDLTVQASLHLCELLFFEYKISEDPAILQEIQTISKRLRELAQNQHAYSVLAETYLLQAKLALLERDVDRARQLLTQAQAIADDKGLQRLARSISHEYDKLLAQISQWEIPQEHEETLVGSREVSGVEELLTRMTRQRAPEPPELQSEDPVLLLILAEGGLTLFSHPFKEEQQLNGHLIGGFLTALSAFGQDALAASGIIDRIMYQDYTVAAKARDVLMFCYIFQGQSYLALQKLEQFMERIGESPDLWQTLTQATKTNAARKSIEAIGTEDKIGLDQLIRDIFHPNTSYISPEG